MLVDVSLLALLSGDDGTLLHGLLKAIIYET